MAPPLVVLDTNVIVDMWLRRDGDHALLLLDLAEVKKIDLAIPEFVLHEFRGTALRLVAEILQRRDAARQTANDWSRSTGLDLAAEDLRSGAGKAEVRAEELRREIDPLVARIRKAANVPEHTQDLHFRGDLRFLSGRPPDRPRDGIQDCRVFEAVLDLAREDVGTQRSQRVLVTKDGDFDYPELHDELRLHGFVIRSDVGKLYGELR